MMVLAWRRANRAKEEPVDDTVAEWVAPLTLITVGARPVTSSRGERRPTEVAALDTSMP